MGITHAKVSAKSDGGDATLVLPSDWNDDHVIAGMSPAFIGAQLTKSAVQSVAGAEAAVTFDGEVFDTDGFHDNVTNNSRLTIPAGMGGKYLVGGSAELSALVDTTSHIIRIRKNGTNADGDGRARVFATGAGYTNPPFSRIVDLSAGGYVELTVEHNNGSASDVRSSSNGTSFWMYKLDSGKVGGGIGAKNTSGSVTLSNGAYVSLAFASADEFDTDAFHDTVTNNTRFTVPAGLAGKYLLVLTGAFPPAANVDRRVGYRINGGTDVLLEREYSTNPGVSFYMAASTVLDLAAGDYVELRLFVDAGAGTGTGYMSIMRLDSGSNATLRYFGGLPSGTLDRSYTFDSTVEGFTASAGTLTVTSGRLDFTGAGTALEDSGVSNLGDFEMECDYEDTLAGTGSPALIFRATNATNGYLLVFQAGYSPGFFKLVSGTPTLLKGSTYPPDPVGRGGPWKILIRCVGTKLEAYINGTLVLYVTDATYSTGRVGLWSDGTSHMYLDNVKVYTSPVKTGNVVVA